MRRCPVVRVSQWNSTSIQVISRFNIAQYVPLGGDISYEDLSKACGVYHFELKQVIRFAIVYHHIFAEKRKGYVSHTAGSYELVQDPLAQAGVGQIDEFYGGFARVSYTFAEMRCWRSGRRN